MSEFLPKTLRFVAATSLILSACAPVVAKRNEVKSHSKITETPTQTFTPTPTETSIPKTPTPEIPTSTPELSFDTKIDGINYDLSNICGPLAADILISYGFWQPGRVVPHDFWTLNPYNQPDRVKKLFPDSMFTYIHFDGPTELHDFKKEPLQPGDFVFLYSADDYGFSHMLAVTEVDEDGAAWSVTNILQTDGSFKIQKVKLYNPNVVGTSILYDPNNPNAPMLQGGWGIWSPHGRTGVKFDVWRLKR